MTKDEYKKTAAEIKDVEKILKNIADKTENSLKIQKDAKEDHSEHKERR